MNSKRIVLASKRAPVTYKWDEEKQKNIALIAPGGTANVVADQASYLGVSWISSAMTDEDREAARSNPDGLEIKFTSANPVKVYLLEHDREVFNSMQEVMTSDIMWCSNNYLWDSWTQPTFDKSSRTVWEHFKQFTQDFADAIIKSGRSDPETVFLIHDYQMVCVPSIVREQYPNNPMLLFVHIPWPAPDYWLMMPKYMRADILKGMLGADTVGFFAKRWVNNFLWCVQECIPEAKVDFEKASVIYKEHKTVVEDMALGYSEHALTYRKYTLDKELEKWIGDKPLLVHSGRTDPMKNAIRGVEAFVEAVQGQEDLKDVQMLVRTNPNRLYVTANKRYRDELEEKVNEANKLLDREAVRFVLENNVDATISCIRRADVLMFNSTIDGQNLTVFESSIVNEKNAWIILSERCGAAEKLKDVCTLINPFDIAEQADAIRYAFRASDEEKEKAFKVRKSTAEKCDLISWVDNQLKSLGIEK